MKAPVATIPFLPPRPEAKPKKTEAISPVTKKHEENVNKETVEANMEETPDLASSPKDKPEEEPAEQEEEVRSPNRNSILERLKANSTLAPIGLSLVFEKATPPIPRRPVSKPAKETDE